MSLLRRRAAERASAMPPNYAAWSPALAWTVGAAGNPYGVMTNSGQRVGIDDAFRNPAVWACVRVLAGTVSMLPANVYRLDAAGAKVPLAAPGLIRNPSARVTRSGWVHQLMVSLLTAGNAYGQIVATDRMGRPTQIELIDPDIVTWTMQGGALSPIVAGVAADLYPLGDLWHLAAYCRPGSPVGMSPIAYGRQSIGTGLAAEEFGSRFFGDGGHPTMAIGVDADIDATQAAQIKAAYLGALGNTREPFVHSKTLRPTPLQIDPDKTQFVDLLRFEVEQACRMFGVPPTMVYAAVSGQNVTYANVAQADLAYYKHSVQQWLVLLEEALSALISGSATTIPDGSAHVAFDVDSVLRADALTRWQTHELALKVRARTVNEVRADEDDPAFDDPAFDDPGIPGGMEPSKGVPSPDPAEGIPVGSTTP